MGDGVSTLIDIGQTAATEPMTFEGAVGMVGGALCGLVVLVLITKMAPHGSFTRVVLAGAFLLFIVYMAGQMTP